MKKIVLSVMLLFTVLTFAQKDELKILKKLYGKETLSSSDIEKFKETLTSLKSITSEESDVVYANFYEGMLPLLEINSLGAKATPDDQMRIFSPEALDNFSESMSNTLEFEKKSGKEIYTKDIEETLSWFKPMLKDFAFQLNSTKKYKEASSLFYSLYKLDKSEGSNLENAAILSVQAEDYKTAEKLYDEYKTSEYLNNGIIYYAINKATDREEVFPNKEARLKVIALKTHEKPRNEILALKKPDVYKMAALIVSKNGDIDKAKKNIEEALVLIPNDADLKAEGFRIYFNEGYDILKDDQKIVEEINNNLDNKTKFEELMEKRKSLFRNSLPFFEKAHQLNANDVNTNNILKLSYELLDMNEKATKIK